MSHELRTYSELRKIKTFEERFEYLKLNGNVCEETFGFDRYWNQKFYRCSPEWKRLRNFIIVRDSGCDLGIEDRMIYDKIIIHHINPINLKDIVNFTRNLIDPEYLICTTDITHKAIHYGSKDLLCLDPIERSKNDTCLWGRRKEI